ncbi:MAG: LysM peptidoglycan-binding domain-containing protein, partial [Verrucomicrobia bacterium]|nr:LysM peptidoglycan-binding domain-containing protein [Verrucomicrobiota bacterium]
LLRGVAPANYQLRVPRGAGSSLVAALDNVPAEKRAAWRMHKVTDGDTLATIARRYGSSATSIAGANPRPADDLEAGDVLLIPCSYIEAKKSPAKSARSGKHRAASKSHRRSKRPVNAKSLHRKATVKRASR